MSEKIDHFCEDLRRRLTAAEAKMGEVKAHLTDTADASRAVVEAKLAEARSQLESTRARAEEAKSKISQFIEETQEEIDDWKAQRKFDKLSARAERKILEAAISVDYALGRIDEATISILEAAAAAPESTDP